MNGSTVRKRPVLPVSATGQLLESPLAETGPLAEKGPMRKTDTSQHLFRPILPNFENRIEIIDDDFGGWSMLPVRKTDIPKK